MPGSLPPRILEWDSGFFGVTIARLEQERLDGAQVEAATRWCEDNGVDCLYMLLASDDAASVRLAEQAGATLTDVRVTMRRKTEAAVDEAAKRPPGPEGSATSFRPATADDLPALGSIARTAHRHSRFYFDASFPDELCDSFYERWIRESVQGFADAVIVADAGGRALGYVTMHLDDPNTARIGLLGVTGQARGRGIGGALARGAVSWAHEAGATDISVATQARNIPALHLYGGRGFLIESVGLWYHLWLTGR